MSVACKNHKKDYIAAQRQNQKLEQQPCCVAAEKFSTRTPGLFKVEWTGDGMIALNSKTYYGTGAKHKLSCKGLNKRQNDLTREKYLHVLNTKKSAGGRNVGFITKGGKTYTYTTFKYALSYFYGKRKVHADGRSTEPLDV